MDKEAQQGQASHQASFDYSLDLHHPHGSRQQEGAESGAEMVDYMFGNPQPQAQISFDKLSFAEVMQFADFGPKLALNQTARISEQEENYFLKFQVLGDKSPQEDSSAAPQAPPPPLPPPPPVAGGEDRFAGTSLESKGMVIGEEGEEDGRFSEDASSVQQRNACGVETKVGGVVEVKNRRKRPRSLKTSEEVESQRMTHIAVERNRRRQMNEHLRVLRSLMPGSYVQRGDQASIIGGAIEFVRELEQLLQCLESQKRRRLFGSSEPPRAMADGPPMPIPQSHQQPFYPSLPYPDDTASGGGGGGGLQEEMAENKSCLSDIEVRLLGYDAMIKILSRRRPGQLLKIIAALEDLQLTILHTNITTIEQTVLYSFNVKITGEARCTAEGIASSVQQILGFIDANTL